MRILFLGNNWLGWQVLRWLRERGEDVVGAVLHPPQKRKYGEELLAAAGLPPGRIFDGSQLGRPDVLEAIAGLRPEIGVSVLFVYLLRPPLLSLFPNGCINLHPSLLPYNRGVYPNVWSIVEGTPSGVTLHYIDEGVDTGDIIAQSPVPVEPIDTGASLYRKLERAALELFTRHWPAVRDGHAPRRPQSPQEGSTHRYRDVDRIDAIDLEQSYQARYLLDVLRARTFPPYPGAYIRVGGRRVYLRLQLEYEPSPPEVPPDANDQHP